MARIASFLICSWSFAALAGDEPVATPKGDAEATAPADEGPGKDEVQQKRDALKFLVGRWSCSGNANTPTAAGLAVTATWKIDAVQDKAWLHVAIDPQKPKDDPASLRGEEWWGFDVDEGAYKRLAIGARGASVTGTSAGWLGDRLDWSSEGTRNGKPWRSKTTIVKKSDKELEVTTSIAVGADELHVMYEAVCKK